MTTATTEPTPPSCYTVAELAERWRTTEVALWHQLRRKQIEGFKVGGKWRVSAAEVAAVEAGKLSRWQ